MFEKKKKKSIFSWKIVSITAASCLVIWLIALGATQQFNFSNWSQQSYLTEYKEIPLDEKFQQALNVLPDDREASKKLLNELSWGLSKEENAKRLYVLAQIEQRSQNYQEALILYESIDLKKAPYLADRILLHIAEINELRGNEKTVMASCNKILHSYSHSASIPEAIYELARSYTRQSEPYKAEKYFTQVRLQYPQAPQSIGALYYLGELSSNDKERDELWSKYLLLSPKGRFS
ncbi:MAG TPA: hypothetical protein V6C96_02245, partial [Vampirovibrionales bacterium]